MPATTENKGAKSRSRKAPATVSPPKGSWNAWAPCPFCGSNDLTLTNEHLDNSGLWHVECRCGARGPDDNETRKQALMAWSFR